jgi:hypothetical protein
MEQKPRKRGVAIDTKIRQALDELATATTAGDAVLIESIKIRISALQKLSARKDRRVRENKNDKLKAALLENERLRLEVESLRQQLATRPAARPPNEMEIALAKFAAEKQNGGHDGN